MFIFTVQRIFNSQQRCRWTSSGSGITEAMRYLLNKGYDEKVVQGIIKAFPSSPSLRELQQLGSIGIQELAKAVVKENERLEMFKAAKESELSINISIPHHHTHFSCKAHKGETFFELTQRYADLKSYLACSCGGIAACSTCHVVVNPEWFSQLPPPDESELDMLDLAYGLTSTSRLGCQIKFDKSMDGLEVILPAFSNDLYYAP